ncbi:hypothetical protein [Leptolyngbya sp. FACHB-261]|uniref:hypothetical protein n=1 Tax=Leptolyngbya sp. FACHB-261 TaxID=2692806 RepID=UPI001684B63F|nr:hypothetical protein [Leptolyngbya sp. FACHB-261]MBD2103353.1 hypothetical protein [Leptolyngbya sp. FACHB-261]
MKLSLIATTALFMASLSFAAPGKAEPVSSARQSGRQPSSMAWVPQPGVRCVANGYGQTACLNSNTGYLTYTTGTGQTCNQSPQGQQACTAETTAYRQNAPTAARSNSGSTAYPLANRRN